MFTLLVLMAVLVVGVVVAVVALGAARLAGPGTERVRFATAVREQRLEGQPGRGL
jgi:hypothetical protein